MILLISLTSLNAATPTDVNINENQSQVSKVTIQSKSDTVSTLSQGTSSICFDTYAIRWNLRQVVKDKELNIFDDNNRADCWKQIITYIPNFLADLN